MTKNALNIESVIFSPRRSIRGSGEKHEDALKKLLQDEAAPKKGELKTKQPQKEVLQKELLQKELLSKELPKTKLLEAQAEAIVGLPRC
jgi:hypothetical protein